MNKNRQLIFRLSDLEYDLIKTCACKLNMTVSQFILSVLIPYCVKVVK